MKPSPRCRTASAALSALLAAACCAGLAGGAGPPARAAAARFAVVPAPVVHGAPGNGAVFTGAVREELGRLGYSVMPETRVTPALRGLETRTLTLRDLAALRRKTGADYVLYPRVLTVGVGAATLQMQATVLVNVQGESRGGFVFTRQVAQPFRVDAQTVPQRAVMSRDAAREAARKVLHGLRAQAK